MTSLDPAQQDRLLAEAAKASRAKQEALLERATRVAKAREAARNLGYSLNEDPEGDSDAIDGLFVLMSRGTSRNPNSHTVRGLTIGQVEAHLKDASA